jgi:hypothetical protein
MDRARTSVMVFGVYLMLLGAGLIVAPTLLLAPFGFATPADFWVRVIGVPVAILGALVDAAGAAWTAWALRADARGAA